MEWSLPAGLLARRLVELELENAGEEVARVGRVAGDVEFGARIEMLLGARDRRDDALIFEPEVVPGHVVAARLDGSVQDVPAPLERKRTSLNSNNQFATSR